MCADAPIALTGAGVPSAAHKQGMTHKREPKRQPKGLPNAGEFAPGPKREAVAVSLTAQPGGERAAVQALHGMMAVYPEADEIAYSVDAAGQVTDVGIVSNGRMVGFLAMEEDGTPRNRGKAGQLRATVFEPLSRTGVDEMEQQGATVEDDTEGGKMVRLRFDDTVSG